MWSCIKYQPRETTVMELTITTYLEINTWKATEKMWIKNT